jgi:hypothetical protein
MCQLTQFWGMRRPGNDSGSGIVHLHVVTPQAQVNVSRIVKHLMLAAHQR